MDVFRGLAELPGVSMGTVDACSERARLLLVTSLMFVDHMQALWGSLSSGALLCLASREEVLGGLSGLARLLVLRVHHSQNEV